MSSDDASPKKPMVSSSANRPASLSLLRSFQSLIPQDALRAISLPYCGRVSPQLPFSVSYITTEFDGKRIGWQPD